MQTIYFLSKVLDATVETCELRSFDGEQSHSHKASIAPRGGVAASYMYDNFITINDQIRLRYY